MKPASEYLVAGVPVATADAWGEFALSLRLAGVDFVFSGLSGAQRDEVVARFGQLVVPAANTPQDQASPGADFRPAAHSQFTPTPPVCWEYDLALDFQPGPTWTSPGPRSSLVSPAWRLSRRGAHLPRGPVLPRLCSRTSSAVISIYVLARRDTRGDSQRRRGPEPGEGIRPLRPLGRREDHQLRALADAADGPARQPRPRHPLGRAQRRGSARRGTRGAAAAHAVRRGFRSRHAQLRGCPAARRIYALVQAPEARVTPCARAEALARVVAACPFVNVDPFESDSVFSRAERLLVGRALAEATLPQRPLFLVRRRGRCRVACHTLTASPSIPMPAFASSTTRASSCSRSPGEVLVVNRVAAASVVSHGVQAEPPVGGAGGVARRAFRRQRGACAPRRGRACCVTWSLPVRS
jgi:hypothetical protein